MQLAKPPRRNVSPSSGYFVGTTIRHPQTVSSLANPPTINILQPQSPRTSTVRIIQPQRASTIIHGRPMTIETSSLSSPVAATQTAVLPSTTVTTIIHDPIRMPMPPLSPQRTTITPIQPPRTTVIPTSPPTAKASVGILYPSNNVDL